MDVSPDFRDLLNEFNAAGVRCLVVGATAVSYHAEPRTKDRTCAPDSPAGGLSRSDSRRRAWSRSPPTAGNIS